MIDRKLRRRWGVWWFEPSNYTLRHEDGGYEIDLEECNDSAEVLDWIVQVAGKGWCKPEDLGNLVLALDDLLYLQKNFCPDGKAQPRLSKAELRRLIDRRVM
jgi:hypothetical protein